jgi:hypothetical protein
VGEIALKKAGNQSRRELPHTCAQERSSSGYNHFAMERHDHIKMTGREMLSLWSCRLGHVKMQTLTEKSYRRAQPEVSSRKVNVTFSLKNPAMLSKWKGA